MDVPVIDPEGHTYEKSAILQWLQDHDTSPMTRSPLKKEDLVLNRALQEAIREALAQGGEPRAREPRAPLQGAEGDATVRLVRVGDTTLLSVVPGEGVARTPVDLVASIDVSGSMQIEATMMNEVGQKESHGLTLLDLVKHATRTLINTLGPGDRLALVAYSTTAREVLPLTPMTPAGRKLAEDALDKLQPEASTNIWDGLRVSMDVLRAGLREADNARLQAVFLLTDGVPNVEPPRGHLPMLERYLQKHPELSFQLSTFGFGYNLNSALLDDLASLGGGRYAFIPDATFVGTTFVHAFANACSQVGKKYQCTVQPSGEVLKLGSMAWGQTRDLILSGEVKSATLSYQTRQGEQVRVSAQVELADADEELEVQRCRVKLVEGMRTAMANSANLEHSQAAINEVLQFVRASPAAGERRVVKLLGDIEGQVTEAFSRKDWFDKWGKHYIPSLRSAHDLQEANNFKDPGVQVYGGKLFQDLRDDADDVFNELPPPKPSIDHSRDMYGNPVGGARAAPAPVRMAAYNNARNVCYAGSAVVRMKNAYKRCDQIVVGDVVASGATVRYIVRSEARALVQVGQLLVTPWHPILYNGEWALPADCGSPARIGVPTDVYSFVLSHSHIMEVDGIKTVTLGHGFKGDVREHAYWGSERVINDVAALANAKGVVEGVRVIRDSNDQVVSLQ